MLATFLVNKATIREYDTHTPIFYRAFLIRGIVGVVSDNRMHQNESISG